MVGTSGVDLFVGVGEIDRGNYAKRPITLVMTFFMGILPLEEELEPPL